MAKLETVGLEESLEQLNGIADWEKHAGEAVYAGAKIAADEVRSQINKIPVRKGNQRGTETNKVTGLHKSEIDGLLDGMGIARAQRSGDEVNVLIGFDGYNSNGKANRMIASSIQSGTSWLNKYPFMTYAKNSIKSSVEEAMASKFEKSIEEENNG